jgi:hypothetical protein
MSSQHRTKMQDLDIKMAKGFPGGIPLPENVPCSNNCKFCYEKNIKQFPKIKTKYIPLYDDKQFYEYVNKAIDIVKSPDSRKRKPTISPITQAEDGQFYYFRKCDFFSLGLTHEQIEMIVKNGAPMTAYTTGYKADPDFVSYLCKQYPTKFNLNLSVITLDPAIRSEMMDSHLTLDYLKRVCEATKNSVYFLLSFTKEQIIKDVDELNELSLKNNNTFSICRLYYSDNSPEEVLRYGQTADECMVGIIDHFARNRKAYKNIESRMTFLPDPPAFAWARRTQLKELVKDCPDEKSTLLICTEGALSVMKTFFQKAHVLAPHTCFGGNINIALSITLQGVVKKIEECLAQGHALKDVYLPNTVFSIDGKYDYNLEEMATIQKIFPQLKFHLIEIPKKLMTFELTLDECIDYYKNMVITQPNRFKEDINQWQ